MAKDTHVYPDVPDIAGTVKNWQGHGGHPPKAEMNVNEIKLMAMLMCPVADIAAFYEFSERQLYRRFAKEPALRLAFDSGRAQGRRMIRHKQFKVAVEDGDPGMLKWLGQNILGQSNRHTIVSEDLNLAHMDDALDVEFKEIFDSVDEKLKADGYLIEDRTADGGTDVPSEVERPRQGEIIVSSDEGEVSGPEG